MIIGFDFDNTLVIYDKIFYSLALNKGYISEDLEKTKSAVQLAMEHGGLKDKFTELQGEVYGYGIFEAPPVAGSVRLMNRLKKQGHRIVVVSHKTRKPLSGAPIDLRGAAELWLQKNGFIHENSKGSLVSDVFFENTFEDKISRIRREGCDVFIDDLRSVVERVSEFTFAIHFSKKYTEETSRIRSAIKMDDVIEIVGQLG